MLKHKNKNTRENKTSKLHRLAARVASGLALRLASRLFPILFAVLATLVVLLPVRALAQDVAPASPSLPADPTDVTAMARLILDAVMNKQWGLLASLAVLVTVAMLRKYVPEKTKLGVWFRTRVGGIVTALLTSAAGAFATAFLAGAPFSLDLVLKALSVMLAASGGWSIFKNLRDALDEKKAQDKGREAASKPADTLDK
jgi:hypothetical protein